MLEEAAVETAGALVLVRLVASHFLWKMARRIVGTLVEAGAGNLELQAVEDLLSGPRAGAGSRFEPARHTAPPSGLFLERVLYPGDPPIPPLRPVIHVPEEAARRR